MNEIRGTVPGVGDLRGKTFPMKVVHTDAYAIAVSNGFDGSLEEWLAAQKGEKGDKGERGERGIQGAQGIPGEKGDKGDKGDQGEQGIQGIRGVQGIQGEKGEKGDKGDKGDTGAAGGYYTPSVAQTGENTMRVRFVASQTGMPEVQAADIVLPSSTVAGFATEEFVEDYVEDFAKENMVGLATQTYVQQYVADNLPGGASETVLLEEQDISGFQSSEVMLDSPIELVSGETYKVVWDGTEYRCVASAPDENTAIIGNAAGYGMSGNGEPFLVMTMLSSQSIIVALRYDDAEGAWTADASVDTHTVAIYHVTGDALATESFVKAYVEQYISEALGGEY